jgi:hypothetical protein
MSGDAPEPPPLTQREMNQFITLSTLPTLERALERLRWLEAQRNRSMDDHEFRGLLDLLMCSDPWPMERFEGALKAFADRMARERGYTDWIDAYNLFKEAKPA